MSQLMILSGNDDHFYVGCTLNDGAVGVERLALLFDTSVSTFSESDALAFSGYGLGAWTSVGSLSISLGCNCNQKQVRAIDAGGGWRLRDVSSDLFGGVFITFHSGVPGGVIFCWRCEVQGGRYVVRVIISILWSTPGTTILVF